jgi:ABC-2 type transport system ATP-binding protein
MATTNAKEVTIEINDLVKKYDDLVAVNHVSFKVYDGEIFAFLGPNGAGKTTTVEIFEGLRSPTEGSAKVFGYDVTKKKALEKIKKHMGTLPQTFYTYGNLTVEENLKFWGRLYPKTLNVDDVIKLLKLEDKKKAKYKELSGGLQRRVGIAIAIINDPELIVLDEPTTGLDPRARRDTWEVIKSFQEKGKTIFLTTHYMEEAQYLADRVAIIHHGVIQDLGTPTELIDKYGGENKIIIRCSSPEETDKVHNALFEMGPMENADGNIIVSSKKGSIAEVIDILEEKNIRYKDIISQRPTLEDVFLALTGETLTSASKKEEAKESVKTEKLFHKKGPDNNGFR